MRQTVWLAHRTACMQQQSQAKVQCQPRRMPPLRQFIPNHHSSFIVIAKLHRAKRHRTASVSVWPSHYWARAAHFFHPNSTSELLSNLRTCPAPGAAGAEAGPAASADGAAAAAPGAAGAEAGAFLGFLPRRFGAGSCCTVSDLPPVHATHKQENRADALLQKTNFSPRRRQAF